MKKANEYDLESILERLFKRGRSKRTLEEMAEIDQKLAFPSRAFRSIHIAGTNGKGTVALNIANSLEQSGVKTGLFISPHVHTVTERIQVNGKMISEEDLARLVVLVMEVSPTLHFFAILTLAAFLYFREQNVGFAVIEAGVGGEFDPTNIIQPRLSLITNVSDDHRDLLGPTLNDIARAKAGILKPKTPAIIGHRAALKPVLQRAFSVLAPLTILPPREDFHEENRLMIVQALKELSREVCFAYEESYSQLPCRFELVQEFPVPFIFDIAHNCDGLEKLFQRVKMLYPEKEIFVIFNMSHIDYILECTAILHRYSRSIYLCDVEHSRLPPVETLKKHLPQALTNQFGSFLQQANRKNALVVVTGSVFIMNEVKEAIWEFYQSALVL